MSRPETVPATTDLAIARVVLDALATGPGEAARRLVSDAAAARLSADYPGFAFTVEQGWGGFTFHAVARAGAYRPGLYAVVTGSEAEMRAILGGAR